MVCTCSIIVSYMSFSIMCRVFQHTVEEINLSGESMVDGEWLAYLGAFRCLHSLKLADCRGVSSSSIWPLSGMTRFAIKEWNPLTLSP
jgi:hypothetical protein